ncbi:MAG: flavin reductase family protein [Phycisphaerae bacterium]
MTDHDPTESLGVALGRVPSGVSIATASFEGRSAGMMASWIQQAAFEPPMITLAVKQGRPIEPLIDGAGRFVLNLVGQDAGSLFKTFSKGVPPGENAFDATPHTLCPSGPVLSEAIGHLECKVFAKHRAGDHDLYLAEVTDGQADGQAQPFVHVRKSGFSY